MSEQRAAEPGRRTILRGAALFAAAAGGSGLLGACSSPSRPVPRPTLTVRPTVDDPSAYRIRPIVVQMRDADVNAGLIALSRQLATSGIANAQDYLAKRLSGRQLRIDPLASGVAMLPITNAEWWKQIANPNSDGGEILKPYLRAVKQQYAPDSRTRVLFFILGTPPPLIAGEAIDPEFFAVFMGDGVIGAPYNDGPATQRLSYALAIVHEWVHNNGGDNGQDMSTIWDQPHRLHSTNPADIMYFDPQNADPHQELDAGAEHDYVDLGVLGQQTRLGTFDVGASPYLAATQSRDFRVLLDSTRANWGKVLTCPHPLRDGVVVQLFQQGAIVRVGRERPIAVTGEIFSKWSVSESPTHLPLGAAREVGGQMVQRFTGGVELTGPVVEFKGPAVQLGPSL